ncbi:MAG: FecR domain-containing protein [Candidatus Nitronauta litoralis]|uniref:FecR domain-containing protein n=1 Tax=Candidatus Nitronauta litoralis TaxID=2705533 RepID=A0A7T0BXG5_9BACT|nr:MAG: FecR domain-containing protein [Candidatus Nitronauta litoralis]
MSWLLINTSNKKIGRLSRKILSAILIASFLAAPGFSFAREEDEVTRMEFIKLMVKNQKQSSVIPSNASALSDEDLYGQIAHNLKEKGFNVLASKNPDQPLSQQEFVRITYAFSDQPAGKSIFEQKQYLKEAEIISTADVGLTTGLQGRAVQFRGEEESYNQSEIAAPVFMQDRVETDLNSMITFTFDDGSTMSLGEDAVVNITEHVYDPERDFRKTIVNVALGAVRFKVTKGKAEGSMFRVITPVAVAGVRGTEFVTIVEPGGKTRIVGLEGKVETFPRLPNGKEGKHEFVIAGTMHEVSKDGSSIGLQQADAALMNRVFQKTNPNKKMKNRPKMTMAKIMKAAKADFRNRKAFGKSINKGNNKAKVNNGIGKAKGLQKKLAKGLNVKGKSLENKLAKLKNIESKILANGIIGNEMVGDLAKNAAKIVAKSAAQSAAKNAAKGVAKLAAKSAAKMAAKDAAKMAAKSAAKVAAQTVAKNAAKNAAQSAAKEAAQTVAKNAAKASATQMAKNAVKETTMQAISTTSNSPALNGNGIVNGVGNGLGNGIVNGIGNGIGIGN